MFKKHLDTKSISFFLQGCGKPLRRRNPCQARFFHASTPRRTDGVFRALTDARIAIPWIDAFHRIQDAGKDAAGGAKPTPADRDLSPKKMQDSYHSVILPLASDKWLSDTYLNSAGHLRLGTIFMDMDALSGVIAYKHTGGGVTTVTAALDRINIENPLDEICDLEYSGHVTYATGRSSMEITCKVAKAPPEGQKSSEKDVLMTFTFTMVSLCPKTKKPVNIPGLIPETPTEKSLYELGATRSAAKKALKTHSLLVTEPNDAESALIHSIWLRQVAFHDPTNPARLPANVSPMSATKLQTAAVMQPQYRNRHNVMIFGGFLLKSTFELAFCCAASFAHARPTFVSADPCTFLNPVPVGSVLYLTATVAYTDPALVDDTNEDGSIRTETENATSNIQSDEKKRTKSRQTRVHIRVDSKVRDVEHGTAKPTGQFHYTFTVDRDVRVMPQTYQEMMIYVEARRRVSRVFENENENENEKTASRSG